MLRTFQMPLVIISRSSMFNSRACSRPIIISLCCFMLKESFEFIQIPTPSLFSTANIKALRGSLGALSVNKLSHIPKLQPISAVYENQ